MPLMASIACSVGFRYAKLILNIPVKILLPTVNLWLLHISPRALRITSMRVCVSVIQVLQPTGVTSTDQHKLSLLILTYVFHLQHEFCFDHVLICPGLKGRCLLREAGASRCPSGWRNGCSRNLGGAGWDSRGGRPQRGK